MNKEELLRELNKLDFKKITTDCGYRELRNIAKKIGAHDFSGRFINYDNLTYRVAMAFLSEDKISLKITDFSHDIYYIENGNVRNVTVADLERARNNLKICIEKWL
jgi:hypothetical protein